MFLKVTKIEKIEIEKDNYYEYKTVVDPRLSTSPMHPSDKQRDIT